jgi:quinoprotein glucose dehydrogenase
MKTSLSALAAMLLLVGSCAKSHRENADWPVYGGNKAGNRYSSLSQINLKNVQDLRVAWLYNSADAPVSGGRRPEHEIQCQPIIVHGILYGTNATLKLFALDAVTGKELWKFDPFRDDEPRYNQSRGVAYWEDGDDKRIFYAAGPTLYAVNASTGMPVTSFGVNGKLSLYTGLDINHDVSNLFVTATSPGIIYKNILIIGSAVSESGDAAPGYVRGFDVVTGRMRWIFHTIPQPGEFGYDTWPKDAYKWAGGTNNWAGLALDEKRGVVYFGTGSPSSDFYGGARAGINLFSDCILALDAETGKMKWYYQTIHHDLWDRDIPCPPNLVTVKHDDRLVDAVVQTTKDGLVYVLDRDSGASLFPVEERPVPTKGLPGEHPWPKQKFPLKPLPFSRQVATDSDITDISPEAHAYVKKLFMETGHDDKFLPPSTTATLLIGYSGGAEWGGNAVDTDGILYQHSNTAPWELRMVSTADRQKEIAPLSKGLGLYVANCSSCHGVDRKGNGRDIPSLVDIGNRLKSQEIGKIIREGQGRMPPFQLLSESQRTAIVDFLENGERGAASIAAEHKDTEPSVAAKNADFPYQPLYIIKVWKKVTDQDGYPGIKPPWGTLNAIDLNTGEYVWRVPLGEYPELAKKGVPTTGTESYGAPLATSGGLIFIAGTRDEKIRAFDKRTGKVVWQYQLPAGGFATPITYEVSGKQYIVIAAGGARGLKPGGSYVAFALPEQGR